MMIVEKRSWRVEFIDYFFMPGRALVWLIVAYLPATFLSPDYR
jgi:hypothetical protein